MLIIEKQSSDIVNRKNTWLQEIYSMSYAQG